MVYIAKGILKLGAKDLSGIKLEELMPRFTKQQLRYKMETDGWFWSKQYSSPGSASIPIGELVNIYISCRESSLRVYSELLYEQCKRRKQEPTIVDREGLEDELVALEAHREALKQIIESREEYDAGRSWNSV